MKRISRILQFLTLLICFMIIAIGSYLIHIDNKTLQKDKGYVFFSLQQESSPFAADIREYQKLEKELQATALYKYYEIYAQPIYVEENTFPNAANLTPADSGYMLDAVQIGQEVCHDFGIELLSGRGFMKDDFLLGNDRRIPVLIGNGLTEYMTVGDSFPAEYLYDTYECVVIGTLRQDSVIYMSNWIYPLENAVVMPGFELADNSAVTDGIKIHYANKVSGVIRAEKGKEKQARSYFASCIENTATGDYSWNATLFDSNLREKLHVGIYEIMLCAVIVMTFIFIAVKRKR